MSQLEDIICELGGNMLLLAGKADNLEDAKKMIIENIKNGKAYEKFAELVQSQGGDISYIENPDKFEKAKFEVKIFADKSGELVKLDALSIGKLSCMLGAGRMRKEDSIDPRVGFVFNKKVGDIVNEGDVIGTIYADDIDKANEVLNNKFWEIK